MNFATYMLPVLLFGCLTASVFADDNAAEEPKFTAVLNVVVPKDDKPFTIKLDELVRLTGQGIAGSTIKPSIKGPAEIVSMSYIRTVVGGQTPIGALVQEFLVKPTGKGEVTVTITVEYPTGSPPKVSKYRFTVDDSATDGSEPQ